MTNATNSHAIVTENLACLYREPGMAGFLGRRTRGLHHLDLSLERGRTLALLGPNGSGKSTALRLMAGLEVPTAGKIRTMGHAPQHRAARRLIGYVPETSPVPPHMSANHFLDYLGQLSAIPRLERKRRAGGLLDRFGLGSVAHRATRSYSRGMLRRLTLAQALIHDPLLILIDEPTAGLDPPGTVVWQSMMEERKQAGVTLVLASHLSQEVVDLTDRVMVLNHGRVRLDDAADTVFVDHSELEVIVRSDDPAAIEKAMRSNGHEVRALSPRRRNLKELFHTLFDGGDTKMSSGDTK